MEANHHAICGPSRTSPRGRKGLGHRVLLVKLYEADSMFKKKRELLEGMLEVEDLLVKILNKI